MVPDDHPLSFLSMRSTAFKDADLIIVLGTRMNYIIGHAAPPRFNADAKIARIDIDADEIATAARKVDIGIVGDCRMVLHQLLAGMKGKVDPGPLQGLAQEAGRRRGGQAQGARRQQVRRGRRHPSAAAVRGDQELHAARRDPGGRRPGDPQLRPPVDADLLARPPAQLGAVRHDGRRPAVRARRQGRQARQAGDLRARRRLVRPERDGARHRRAPQAAGAGGDQPQRRLDRRSQARQARPRPRLHALRQDGRGARLLRRVRREARGHPPGAGARAEEGRQGHGGASSTCGPTTAPAPARCSSRSIRRELAPDSTERAIQAVWDRSPAPSIPPRFLDGSNAGS